MCGRFAQPRSADELADLFGARAVTDLAGERFNVAPTDPVAAVVEHHGERQLDVFRWGLVPVYASDPREGARMINARAETIESSPVFRTAFRRWRCIIPADAFYEWRRPPGSGDSRTQRRGSREPFAIHRRDGQPLALAGLWAVWRDPRTAERLYSCTIVTTAANEVVIPLHARMPVILDPDSWAAWLAETTELAELRPLLSPAPDDLLEAYPVSAAVNDVRRNGPELLEPVVLGAAPAEAAAQDAASSATPTLGL
jgi:putative SOS response-associated peptidase YedK